MDSQKFDQQLLDLVWSLWTELGVVGITRKHQNCLIAPEELILLTVVIMKLDSRLRDESLDWCTRYHHFISISRLRALVKVFGKPVIEPISVFAATLNSVSDANWPLFTEVKSLKYKPSGKSKQPRCELPALLYLRIRSLFGVGARADLMTFFLTQSNNEFTAADTTEIGYSKRSLADLLDSFVQSGLFEVFKTRNHLDYHFIKREQMTRMLGAFPETMPNWRTILEVLLPLRECIQRVENKSEATKMVEIRNTLIKLEGNLRRLELTPPPFQSDFSAYLDSFSDWIMKVLESFAQGVFKA